MPTVRLLVYSDYLCPWCFNLSVRLHRLQRELAGALQLEWRAFLLRPEPRRSRSLSEFRAYTETWMRPAADTDAGEFRVWASDAGPPSHSLPAHVVAKAAARLGDAPFQRLHEQLLYAYFAENRDISDHDTLAAIWRECDLPSVDFPASDDPELVRQVLADYQRALTLGINGVPAVLPDGQDAFVSGAQPYETYRRWVQKLLATG